ncbi:MAG: ATP-binding cassette domain-containing protein [Xanthobacteraceae bacterium]|nr:ATP-binding cassette domain-containing protein [Xanthobacteraceae bacterium]
MRAPPSDLPIVFEQATLQAGDVAVLRGVSLALGPGAPTVLIGPNGAGKTTLIRLAASLIAPTSGRVTWGGKPGTDGRRIAVVFQRPVMLRRSTAANVAYALPRCSGRERGLRTNELLLQVGLAHLAERPARRLSGGEQQRLALARALARDPEVLFLDEPTASLDPASTKTVEDVVRTVAASGVKVAVATQNLGQARRLAGDVVFMLRGRVHERAAVDQFFNTPQTAEAAAFLNGDLVV